MYRDIVCPISRRVRVHASISTRTFSLGVVAHRGTWGFYIGINAGPFRVDFEVDR